MPCWTRGYKASPGTRKGSELERKANRASFLLAGTLLMCTLPDLDSDLLGFSPERPSIEQHELIIQASMTVVLAFNGNWF